MPYMYIFMWGCAHRYRDQGWSLCVFFSCSQAHFMRQNISLELINLVGLSMLQGRWHLHWGCTHTYTHTPSFLGRCRGFELRSSWFHSRPFINWAVSPGPDFMLYKIWLGFYWLDITWLINIPQIWSFLINFIITYTPKIYLYSCNSGNLCSYL